MKSNRRITRTWAAVAASAATLPAMAKGADDGMWNHHSMMGGSGAGWIMGPLMMLLFLAAAVAVVVLVVRWLATGQRDSADDAGATGDAALRILKERFARGEIDEEEFRQRKEKLEES